MSIRATCFPLTPERFLSPEASCKKCNFGLTRSSSRIISAIPGLISRSSPPGAWGWGIGGAWGGSGRVSGSGCSPPPPGAPESGVDEATTAGDISTPPAGVTASWRPTSVVALSAGLLRLLRSPDGRRRFRGRCPSGPPSWACLHVVDSHSGVRDSGLAELGTLEVLKISGDGLTISCNKLKTKCQTGWMEEEPPPPVMGQRIKSYNKQ